MQIKTTMRYHLTSVRMAIINKSMNNKCRQGCADRGMLLHCAVGRVWMEIEEHIRGIKGSGKNYKKIS